MFNEAMSPPHRGSPAPPAAPAVPPRPPADPEWLTILMKDVPPALRDYPLHAVCHAGVESAVRAQLNEGANPNAHVSDTVVEVRRRGTTPLIVAARAGHVHVIVALLEAGANVDLAKCDGGTPLYIAAQNAIIPVLECLVQRGADLDLADEDGYSPLQVAVERCNVEVVQCLVSAGANVNAEMGLGCGTPLLIASDMGNFSIAECLLKAGANANDADPSGFTPLYMAAQNGHDPIIGSLVEHGALVDLAMPGGGTPLLIASQQGRVRAVKCLLKAGANANLGDRDGTTPLYMACAHGWVEARAPVRVGGRRQTGTRGAAACGKGARTLLRTADALNLTPHACCPFPRPPRLAGRIEGPHADDGEPARVCRREPRPKRRLDAIARGRAEGSRADHGATPEARCLCGPRRAGRLDSTDHSRAGGVRPNDPSPRRRGRQPGAPH